MSEADDLRATELLVELSGRLIPEGDPAVIYHEILKAAITLTNADAGTLQLLDQNTQELILLTGHGFEPDLMSKFARVDRNSTTSCGLALRRMQRAFIDFDDPELDDNDGELRMHVELGYLTAQSTPLVTRAGKPIGMVSTHWRQHHYRPADRALHFLDILARQAADLIEQERIEAALRQSETLMRHALAIETVGVLFFELTGRITDANKAFERMSGYTAAELRSLDWRAMTPPEFMGITEWSVANVSARGDTPPYEKQHIRKDGTRWWGLFAPTRISGTGPEGECVEFIVDITERKQAEAALRATKQELESRVRERTSELSRVNQTLVTEVRERRSAEERVKKLLRKLVNAQEEERRKIARELHDTLGQQLAALHMSLEIITTKVDGRVSLKKEVERMRKMFDRVNSDVDFLAWELRPPSLDLFGLDAALETFVKEWSQQFGVDVGYQAIKMGGARFDPEVEINLYRIFQEALLNIHKHADATRVNVLLERHDDEAVLVIEDNGKGYAENAMVSAEKAMGLTNMRERAALIGGRVEVESEPGSGTTVFVRVPVEEHLRKGAE